MPHIKQLLTAIIVCLILLVGVNYVMGAYNWKTPSMHNFFIENGTPTGNVLAPVNVSNVGQYKEGALGIGGLLRAYGEARFDGLARFRSTVRFEQTTSCGRLGTDANGNLKCNQ